MNPHTAAAIAQLVFFVPMIPIAVYIMIKAWRFGPRMAWYPPVPYALLRVAGGIMVIIEGQNPTDGGIIIATIVLLNIGLIPVVMTFLGIVRLVLESNFKDNKRAKNFILVVRYNILGAVGLLSTAGGLVGQPEHAQTQSTLSKVAVIQFVCIVAVLAGLCSVLYFAKSSKIKEDSMIYVRWSLVAFLPLSLRLAYGLVSVYEASGDQILTSMWSPLFGSASLFAAMALLPEYVTVCIYLYLGFHRSRTGDRERLDQDKTRNSRESNPLEPIESDGHSTLAAEGMLSRSSLAR